MRLRKQKKVVAVTLATAIAVSTISASASAVSYDLSNGDVTVDQDKEKGAFSYQGEDKGENRTYVNEDKKDEGKIIVKQENKDEATSNTVTVKEDVKKTEDGRDVDIVVDGVKVDTSATGKNTVTVGEGADVDLTVKDSTLTTGGNGIDVGKDLDGKDENKDTKVDLTLKDSTINLTNKNGAGLNVQEGAKADLTLEGDNIIDGVEAIRNATKEYGSLSKVNANVEGIRVGGQGASDSSDAKDDSKLTIQGSQTDSSLTIKDTTTGMVMAAGSDVTMKDGADVTIRDTHTSASDQSSNAVIQHGDLTLTGGSSLTIDTVDKGGKSIGIASWDDITVDSASKLEIKGTSEGIYGHQDSTASLTVDHSTLDITDSGAGVRYEGGAADGSHTAPGDITFKDSNVNINTSGLGISTGNYGGSNITLDHTTANITVTPDKAGTYAIYGPEVGGKGDLTIKNGSKLTINANYGILSGFRNIRVADASTVTSNTPNSGILFKGNGLRGSKRVGTKLHITGNSVYDLTGGSDYNYHLNATGRNNSILVDNGGKLSLDLTDAYVGIGLGNGSDLTVNDGTVLVKGSYVDVDSYKGTGILAYGPNSSINIQSNAHVEAPSITRDPRGSNQNLVVTGGTLTYGYSADNTLWPVNAQGDRLTNFLLTKDDDHADFGAFSYDGTQYEYVSDLNKETDKSCLSVWVPAAALEYMLDVDGSHDPEIIGKALEDLKNAGYNFSTAYKTTANGDEVIVLRDLVANGHSLNFTKTTDAEGNTKLIWGSYDNRADGAPSAYDMVYGTEYENEGKKYTIVWGYESQHNPDTSAEEGVLDGFNADSNVLVNGEDPVVTIYGALREVKPPVIDSDDSDPTPDPAPVTPDQPDTPTADVTPETPAAPETPATPVSPAVQETVSTPTASALPKTGVNWMAALAMALSGIALTTAGAFTSLLGKNKH